MQIYLMKKSIIAAIFFLGLIFIANAQGKLSEDPAKSKSEIKNEKKAAKKEKKATKKAERKQEQKEITLKSNAMISSRFWVLEATTVQGRSGSGAYNLDPSLNFIVVEQDKGTIQLAFGHLVGWNGVGGITLDGNIKSYEVIPGKKDGDAVTLTARFVGPGVNADLRLRVSGEFGDVTISGTFSNSKLTLRGRLVHPNESFIYKGMRSN